MIRNFFGNVPFSVLADCTAPWAGGLHNYKYYREGFQALLKREGPLYEEMVRKGIIGTQYGDAELRVFAPLFESMEAPGAIGMGRRVVNVMNRFPYTNGHLLISPSAHKGEYDQLTEAELLEMQVMTRDAVGLLRHTVHAQGFNVGVNLGHCSGAGLPDHIHTHIVPRWVGDTNYMAVLGDTRVIPEGLDTLLRELVKNVGVLGIATA